MSTGYKINNGSDLSTIFKPRGTTTAIANTGFNDLSGNDLSTRFKAKGSSTTTIGLTGYNVGSSKIDLNALFMDINFVEIVYTATGNYTSSQNSGYTILQFNVGSSSVTFNTTINNAGMIIVGAGGRGGNGGADFNSQVMYYYGGGGGGGGGITYISSTSIGIGTKNISVGDIGTNVIAGGQSSVNEYISYGGSPAENVTFRSGGKPGGNGGSINTIHGGGGGGGAAGYNNTTTSLGGANINGQNSGQISSTTKGGDSYIKTITIPFSPFTLNVGGGGGGGDGGIGNNGDGFNYAGFAGNGTGGMSKASSTKNDTDGKCFGSGGGGGGQKISNIGGNGGTGVVYIWWPTQQ
jgi:hypothetical protein